MLGSQSEIPVHQRVPGPPMTPAYPHNRGGPPGMKENIPYQDFTDYRSSYRMQQNWPGDVQNNTNGNSWTQSPYSNSTGQHQGTARPSYMTYSTSMNGTTPTPSANHHPHMNGHPPSLPISGAAHSVHPSVQHHPSQQTPPSQTHTPISQQRPPAGQVYPAYRGSTPPMSMNGISQGQANVNQNMSASSGYMVSHNGPAYPTPSDYPNPGAQQTGGPGPIRSRRGAPGSALPSHPYAQTMPLAAKRTPGDAQMMTSHHQAMAAQQQQQVVAAQQQAAHQQHQQQQAAAAQHQQAVQQRLAMPSGYPSMQQQSHQMHPRMSMSSHPSTPGSVPNGGTPGVPQGATLSHMPQSAPHPHSQPQPQHHSSAMQSHQLQMQLHSNGIQPSSNRPPQERLPHSHADLHAGSNLGYSSAPGSTPYPSVPSRVSVDRMSPAGPGASVMYHHHPTPAPSYHPQQHRPAYDPQMRGQQQGASIPQQQQPQQPPQQQGPHGHLMGASIPRQPVQQHPVPPHHNQNMMPQHAPMLHSPQNTGPIGSPQCVSQSERLTLAIANGKLWGPRRLNHDHAVNHFDFEIREDHLAHIRSRPDLEIVLTAYAASDQFRLCCWPEGVSIQVNQTPLQLDRTETTQYRAHMPVNMKRVCRVGRNTIQIAVEQCACSFLFSVYMVHMPELKMVVQGLMRKRLVSPEMSKPTLLACLDGRASLEVSLICPFSHVRITTPTRTTECQHMQPFELENYLRTQAKWPQFICPLCGSMEGQLEKLVIDEFLSQIFRQVDQSVTRVMIHANGSWQPLPPSSSPYPSGPQSSSYPQGPRHHTGGQQGYSYPPSASILRPVQPGTPSSVRVPCNGGQPQHISHPSSQPANPTQPTPNQPQPQPHHHQTHLPPALPIATNNNNTTTPPMPTLASSVTPQPKLLTRVPSCPSSVDPATPCSPMWPTTPASVLIASTTGTSPAPPLGTSPQPLGGSGMRSGPPSLPPVSTSSGGGARSRTTSAATPEMPAPSTPAATPGITTPTSVSNNDSTSEAVNVTPTSSASSCKTPTTSPPATSALSTPTLNTSQSLDSCKISSPSLPLATSKPSSTPITVTSSSCHNSSGNSSNKSGELSLFDKSFLNSVDLSIEFSDDEMTSINLIDEHFTLDELDTLLQDANGTHPPVSMPSQPATSLSVSSSEALSTPDTPTSLTTNTNSVFADPSTPGQKTGSSSPMKSLSK